MKVVRCLLVVLVALQTGVAGGRAHAVTCAGMTVSEAAHLHAHQFLDLLDAENEGEPEREQDHDADTIEVTALLAAQASVNSVDVDAPACLFAPFVVSYPDQPAPHLLGLPPATAGPPRRPLYLTFCSFRK